MDFQFCFRWNAGIDIRYRCLCLLPTCARFIFHRQDTQQQQQVNKEKMTGLANRFLKTYIKAGSHGPTKQVAQRSPEIPEHSKEPSHALGPP